MDTKQFRKSIASARDVGTPIITIRTADPASAMAHVQATLNGSAASTPLICYDFITGVHGRNELGNAVVSSIWSDQTQVAPSEMLAKARGHHALPADTIIFFLNPHKLWEQPDTMQAIWNVRDSFKIEGQMLVLITTRGATLPAELASDVMVLDEPLPASEDLTELISTTLKAAKLEEKVAAETRAKAIDALLGLPMFPAEQALAMSLDKNGVNISDLWTRKRQTIEQTRGLSVHRGTESLSDVRGCDQLVGYLEKLMTGEDPPRGVVFIDEINDAFAGTDTDSSGTKSDLQGTLLSHMVDHNADGILLLGPAGTGKTLLGKAAASVTNCLMIHCDIAGMLQGIVGSSGENFRAALSVIDATTQGRALWIGTCNSTTNLPPQLKRRFRDGTFYVDLPDDAGRIALWDLFEKKYGVSGTRPKDHGWTGAEIENCCRKARRMKMTLIEASKYIIPVSVSDADKIKRMRQDASGRYLSASHSGVYVYSEAPQAAAAATPSRRINVKPSAN